MTLFRLIIFVFILKTNAQTQLNKPDLTLFVDYNNNKATCIVESKTSGEAITISQSLTKSVATKEDFKYISSNGITIPSEICNFEDNWDCQRQESNVITEQSGVYHFAPVTDERWNSFRIFKTFGGSKPEYSDSYKVFTQKFYVSVSIRTVRDAQILLCNDETQATRSSCYWILIDAFPQEHNKVVALRKCVKGVPNDYPRNDAECSMRRDQTKLNEQLFKEMEWKHFTISKDNNNTITFWESNFNEPLLIYQDLDNTFDIDHIYFRGYYNAIAEWKIHKYNYLRITKPNVWIQIGPQYQVIDDVLCISLYVALCSSCEIEFQLQCNVAHDTEPVILTGNNETFVKWQNIKIQMYSKQSRNCGLIAIGSHHLDEDNSSPFWAVDDIRRCDINEIKVVSTTITSKDKIYCNSLQHPEWKNKVTDVAKEENELIQCSDPSYTGIYCNVSCYSVFEKQYCGSNKICRLTDLNEQNCICASGYDTNTCQSICRSGTYGYNCKKKCGNCESKASCDMFNGHCKKCEDGYDPPFCILNTLPYLLNPPMVTLSSFTSVEVQLENIDAIGVKKAITYNIEYRQNNDKSKWNSFGTHNQLEENSKILITDLKPETNYLFRVILFTDTNEAYRKEDIPTVQIRTLCEVDRNIIIEPSMRSANVTLQGNEKSCTLDNYYYTIYENDMVLDANRFLAETVFINKKLKPYTTYKLLVQNDIYKNYSFAQLFNTTEDRPEMVENLRSNTTNNEIILSWDVPTITNGIIRTYLISYKRLKTLQYKDCVEEDNKVTYKTVTAQETSVVIHENLIPYSLYEVIVQGQTVADGIENKIYINTSMTAEAADEELPTELHIKSSATFITVTWDLPPCSNRKGHIKYNVQIKCIKDDWCQNEKVNLYLVEGAEQKAIFNELIPFTNYLIEFRATRPGEKILTENYMFKEFKTDAGVPPPVQNLEVYSKTDQTISIRWIPPYPPHGEIKTYRYQQCLNYYHYESSCSSYAYEAKPIPCKLWPEFLCFTFNGLYKNYFYTIFIRAENKNVSKLGKECAVTTKTKQESSDPPWNLTSELNETRLILFWNHPNITNGPLKNFQILLKQIESDLVESQETTMHNYILTVDKPTLRYDFEIEDSIQYASVYTISISGTNEFKGKSENITVITPPETPKLIDDIQVIEDEETNTTITVGIPGIRLNTKTKSSFLLIIVTKTQTKNIKKRDISVVQNNKESILQLSKSPKDSWIASELEPKESEELFVIGDNSVKKSTFLNESLVNKPLEPETSYDITILLLNQYRDKVSHSEYKINAVTAKGTKLVGSSNGIYSLLLLFLIVPIIGWLVYRHINKAKSQSMLSVFHHNGTDSHQDPDIIPLTQASNDNNIKKKRPAIAPKPTISFKKEVNEQQAEEDYVNIEPNNFHSRLVPLHMFESYLKVALETGELAEQHALFPRGQTKPWDYGMLKQNKYKNRYNNLIAYDDTRVKLKKVNNDTYSDYINANYINGYKQDKAYIATQGPKLATLNDFWRMIWQENVQYIVMLANIIEGEKKKCEKYWPDIEKSHSFGHIEVKFTKTEVYADFEYRTLEIEKDDERRIVTQLHFTSWPDHGVPLYPQSLVPFLRKILTISQDTAPIVVHCSAGVGRTGTIILCDICLRMAAREKAIDALRYLHEIREQRANLVDNIDQYKLAHMVLLECLLTTSTNIPCDIDISNKIQNLIDEGDLQKQLSYLEKSSWQDQALNFTTIKPIASCNDFKNRFENITPLHNRVYISRYPATDENSDYINAVPVDGFRFKDQFIVTQTPLPETVNDFWRMVIEKEIKVIVSLNEIPIDDKTCCIFWPLDDEELNPSDNFKIKYHKLKTHDLYNIHRVIIEDSRSEENEVVKIVEIVQFKHWNYKQKIVNKIEDLVMLWEETENLSRRNYPMVVTCYDGATACGLFVALSFVIEKIKLEQQCDVCLAVRVIRRNRREFIADKIQFEFLYKAAIAYLNNFETYSNFQPLTIKSVEE